MPQKRHSVDQIIAKLCKPFRLEASALGETSARDLLSFKKTLKKGVLVMGSTRQDLGQCSLASPIEIRSELASRFARLLTVAGLFLFSLTAHNASAGASEIFIDEMFGVDVTTDVQYGSSLTGDGVNVARYLDIYRPTGMGLPDDLPAIVLMHGGFFMFGDKADATAAAYGNAFASRGYVTVSINYRLVFTDNFPNPPGDPLTPVPSRYTDWMINDLPGFGVTNEQYLAEIAAAVADQGMAVNWLADNAETYNLDPRKIAVGGWSAGAISSLMLGMGVVDDVQADVGAVFSIAGGLLGYEPFVDAGDPGVFIIHGDQDTLVPFSEVGYLQTALTDEGVAFDSMIIEGAGHSTFQNVVLADPDPLFEFMIGQLNAQAVPEPSSMCLFLLGTLAMLSAMGRRRRRRRR